MVCLIISALIACFYFFKPACASFILFSFLGNDQSIAFRRHNGASLVFGISEENYKGFCQLEKSGFIPRLFLVKV